MKKIAKNYDLKDDEILCPVCGTLVKFFDVCPVCNWENTGEVNIDGGPNKMSLKAAIEAFANGSPIE